MAKDFELFLQYLLATLDSPIENSDLVCIPFKKIELFEILMSSFLSSLSNL